MPKLRVLEDFMPAEANPLGRLLERNWPPYQKYEPPEGLAIGIRAQASANQGRWFVQCPFCAGAQLASHLDHRFFCVDCLHLTEPAAAGRWLEVEWPAELNEIEELLLLRPEANRNWTPDETIVDLARDNALHGLGVIDVELSTKRRRQQ
jgi:hypothetical protein